MDFDFIRDASLTKGEELCDSNQLDGRRIKYEKKTDRVNRKIGKVCIL